MLFEGVKLMFVGMTTVLLFLCFMILLLQLVSKLTHGIALKEVEAIDRERKKRASINKKKKSEQALDNEEEIAVISAAIAAFEAEKSLAT